MQLKRQQNHSKGYLVLFIVFLCIVSVNFFKPFGFFRESNPAFVCINATYWNNHPDIRAKHIPVTSYTFDKTAKPSTQLDATITTTGHAWFSVPYYFIQITGLPIGAITMRIFSLLWLSFTLMTVYLLCKQLMKSSNQKFSGSFLTVILYLFSPGIMWYNVHVWVHEVAVLPVYYLTWLWFVKYLDEQKIKWLVFASVGTLIGIQFDWLPCIQAAVMFFYLLFKIKKLQSKWHVLLPCIGVFAGLSYLIYHYASWAGWNEYLSFMKEKFLSRTVGKEGRTFISFLPAKLNIFLFYAISYSALLVISLLSFIKGKVKQPVIFLMIFTAILHHIAFFGFSSEHDYATLKMAFPICFAAAVFVAEQMKRNLMITACTLTVPGIAQYFLLHNYNFRKGIYEDENFCFNAGNFIRQNTSADEVVFMDTEYKYFPQVEFYAGKPYLLSRSAEDANRLLQMNYQGKKGAFISINPLRIERLPAEQSSERINDSGVMPLKLSDE